MLTAWHTADEFTPQAIFSCNPRVTTGWNFSEQTAFTTDSIFLLLVISNQIFQHRTIKCFLPLMAKLACAALRYTEARVGHILKP